MKQPLIFCLFNLLTRLRRGPLPLLAILMLALVLAACRPRQGSGGGPSVSEESTAATVPVAWQTEHFAGRLSAVRHAPGRLACDLTLSAGSPMPASPVAFNFCLPDTQTLTLKVNRYMVGARNCLTSATAVAGSPPRETGAVSLVRMGIMRDNAIYRLTFSPAFFEIRERLQAQGMGALEATVEIGWPMALDGAVKEKPPVAARGLAQVQRHCVANPEDLGRWAVQRPAPVQGLHPRPNDPRPLAPQGSPWFRLRIPEDGLYRLNAQELARAGLTEPGALARVRLFSQGKPVPLYRIKLTGGDDAVLFYGWKSRTPYDPQQVYWLTVTDKAPDVAGLAAEPALLQGEPRELRTLHKQARLNRDHELKISHGAFMRIVASTWVDGLLTKDQPRLIPLGLDAPTPLDDQGTLKARLRFFPDPEVAADWDGTEAELRFGTAPLAHFKFTTEDASFEREADLPASIFTSGPTTLTLAVTKATSATLPGEGRRLGLWLDSVEVAYEGYPKLDRGRLTLDAAAVTTSTTSTLFRVGLGAPGIALPADLFALAVHPATWEARRLPTKNRQLVFPLRGGWQAEVFDLNAAPAPPLEPIQWHDELLADAPADVLIVTHAMFMDALKPLVAFHERRGLKTRVVDVQRLYDLFSDGMLSPLAIRDYVGYGATHWRGGLPQYLLLFGDCTEDYGGAFRSPVRNLVPSYTTIVDEDQWPADYWYSLIAGEDMLPDLIVSRIPVNNLVDAKAVIDKTIRYGENRMMGPWRTRLTLVADNLQEYRMLAERGRQSGIPPAIETRRLYLDEMPLEDNWYVMPHLLEQDDDSGEESLRKVSSAATNAIKDTLNSGTQVMEYLGHGSPNLWAHERIWFGGGSPNRDSQYLKADGRYAFIINYSCSTGKIDYPLEPWNICISEDLLRTPDGGALGLFVPAGLGSPPIQELLMKLWHDSLFKDRLRGIGELATLVRARYALSQNAESHLLMYQLLGDPTVALQMVGDWRELKVTPAVAQPGLEQVEVALDGIAPERGNARLWLENEHGDILVEMPPMTYTEGGIRQTLSLPKGLESPQRLRLALYAWDEEEGRDLLAAGWLSLERPTLAIAVARAQRVGERFRFTVELENKGKVASEECRLRIYPAPADLSAAPLAEQPITLAAGERRSVELDTRKPASAGAKGAPVCFEAVLNTPHPPDDPAQGAPQRHLFALAPTDGWLGWVPPFGVWLNRPGASEQIILAAMAAERPAGDLRAMVRGAAGDNLTTSLPLTFVPRGETFLSTLTLTNHLRRKALPSDVVELIKFAPGVTSHTLARMMLADLPRQAPALRLDPKSIVCRPQSPTDGETVFVSFTVVNRGSAPSDPCHPALLTNSMNQGGSPLPMRTDLRAPRIPALGSGRSWPVTLRWDPLNNAGVQTITVDINPLQGRSAAEEEAQSQSQRLYVRSKSKLSRGKPLPPLRTKDDQGKPGFRLRVEVINSGETDARNVEVLFYRTPQKTEANLLGVVPVAVVPRRGSVVAALNCQLNEAADRPVAEIRLKGSAQIIVD